MDFTIRNTLTFENANEAFQYLYRAAGQDGIEFDGTKALFNIGFYIMNPLDNHITTPYRKWNPVYANREWTWYLSGDPSAVEISKFAPIWKNMMDEDGKVRSNYGWQWGRKNQLEKIVEMLHNKPDTRKAAISIYDGKEIKTYSKDTPCTYAVQFTIINNKLNMSVYMRSNDIWYGFCNDQYCFSMLQKLVADSLNIEIGWYYHHAHNMHLYNEQL
jgi:thymidylate synthase